MQVARSGENINVVVLPAPEIGELFENTLENLLPCHEPSHVPCCIILFIIAFLKHVLDE